MLTYLCLIAGIAVGQPSADPPIHKVLLIGDSIRMDYGKVVDEKLKDQVIVISPTENGNDSANVIKNLDKWLADKPVLVTLNAGLHDIKFKDGKHQVSPEAYEKNLKEIVTKIRASGARVVFLTTTPINDEQHKARKAGFERTDAAVKKYNEIAAKVMKAENVQVVDLYAVVIKAGQKKIQKPDGTHYLPEGSHLLGTAVAEAIQQRLGSIKQ